jgi:hypothetical protein
LKRLILISGCALVSALVGAYSLLLHEGRSPYPSEVLDERIHARTIHGDHAPRFEGFWVKEDDVRPLVFLEKGGALYRAGSGRNAWHNDKGHLYFDIFPSCGVGAPKGCFSSKCEVKWIDDDTFELSATKSSDADTYHRVNALSDEFRKATVEQYGLGSEEESYRAFWIVEVMADLGHWDRDQMWQQAADLYDRKQGGASK